jgi:hypothetical protein
MGILEMDVAARTESCGQYLGLSGASRLAEHGEP